MLSNSWVVKADIKFKYYSSVPTFRRRDTAIINFLIYDNKKLYDISSFSKGEVTITFPQGGYIKRPCQKVNINGVDYIQYIFNKDEIVELGVYKVILSFEDNTGRVSLQEILVGFFDTIGTSELAYIELIQDLQNQSDYLESIVNDIIQKDEKDVANGIAKLDSDGKIDISHMPSFLENHTKDSVFKNWVHGLYIDENFVAKYRTKDGGEENVGHPDLSDSLRLFVTVSDGIANLTFSGKGSAITKRYMYGDKTLQDAKVNGTLFTNNDFPVDKVGIWSIYYKDDRDKEYIYKFPVEAEDLKNPNITISVSEGEVTVTDDSTYALEIQKWDTGIRDVTHFQINGNVFADTFIVDTKGTYSVYRKYTNGLEIVKVFEVKVSDLITVPPSISLLLTPNNQTWTNTDKTVNVTITDKNTIVDKRYYYSTTNNITVDNFRNNSNFGTAMSSNNQNVVISNNGYLYVYTKNKGNLDTIQQISITSIDKVLPNISLTPSTTSWTNQNITVSISLSENESGISTIKWASGNLSAEYFENNGTVVSNSFTVNSNGDYTVYAKDNAGNSSVKTIVISNIDKIAPTASSSQAQSNGIVTITVNAIDSESGVDRFIKPDNSIVYSATTTYSVSSNGNYTFTVLDKAGNSFVLNVIVNSIVSGAEILKNAKVFTNADGSSVIFLTSHGDVYGVGDNVSGELGLPYSKTGVMYPTKIPNISNVTDVCFGDNYSTWFKTSNGDWYITGISARNFATGVTGHSFSVIKVTLLNNVKKIYIKDTCARYLTNSGDIYTLSASSRSPAYAGCVNTSSNTLEKVNISGVQDFIASFFGTYYKKTDGWYSAGYTVTNYKNNKNPEPIKISTIGTISGIYTENSQWGRSTHIRTNLGVYADGFNSGYTGNGVDGNTDQITDFIQLPLNNVQEIYKTKNETTFFKTSNGDIYGIGSNGNGELGVGHKNKQKTLEKVLNISGTSEIKGHNDNSIFKSGNNWYSSGAGRAFQNGNESWSDVTSPVLVTAFTNAGLTLSSLVPVKKGLLGMATDGYWYAVGGGDSLGLNTTSPTITPVPITTVNS